MCGDGIVQDTRGEQCDTNNLAGKTCQDFGFTGGSLDCKDDCTLDTSGCTGQPTCGNGVIDSGEQCDGSQLGSDTCESLGYYGGTLACSHSCQFDVSDCQTHGMCGDGIVQDTRGEQCDTNNLAGKTCQDFGFTGGSLDCKDDCTLDTSGCTGRITCGNGVIDSGEQCDGNELGGNTCTSLGYYGGILSCNADCTLNTDSCEIAGRCGDGSIQTWAGEECDGSNLGRNTCESLGYSRGTLTCTRSCTFDTSQCEGMCGNGVKEVSEECDGSAFGSASSCEGLGYWYGTPECSDTCELLGCHGVIEVGMGVDSLNSCALTDEEQVWCWGSNSSADLGTGNHINYLTPTVPVLFPSGVVITRLEGGEANYAIDDNGVVWCWGLNNNYECGIGTNTGEDEMLEIPEIVHFPYGVRIVQVSGGNDAGCAIDDQGKAWCWGYCDDGQCGDGDTANNTEPAPVDMSNAVAFTQIAMGSSRHVCALDTSGDAWCWGDNSNGQIGIAATGGYITTPRHINMPSTGEKFMDICANRGTDGVQGHTCALDTNGEAWCWGLNDRGQLGRNDSSPSTYPQKLSTTPQGVTFTNIECGSKFTCALSTTGDLYCWGDNNYGQMGNGASDSSRHYMPTAVSLPGQVTDFTVRANSICAIIDNGDLYCWGANGQGQLGDGSTTDSATPVRVVAP